MNSELYDMIFKRKSFHIFRNLEEEVISEEELADICKVWESFDALYPEIKTAIRIIPGSDTNCRRGEEYCILFYSEKKDGYLQNIGYLGEQLGKLLVSGYRQYQREILQRIFPWEQSGLCEVPRGDGYRNRYRSQSCDTGKGSEHRRQAQQQYSDHEDRFGYPAGQCEKILDCQQRGKRDQFLILQLQH